MQATSRSMYRDGVHKVIAPFVFTLVFFVLVPYSFVNDTMSIITEPSRAASSSTKAETPAFIPSPVMQACSATIPTHRQRHNLPHQVVHDFTILLTTTDLSQQEQLIDGVSQTCSSHTLS